MFLASNGVCTKVGAVLAPQLLRLFFPAGRNLFLHHLPPQCKATGCRTCSASGTKCTKCMQENMYIHTSGSCREVGAHGWNG